MMLLIITFVSRFVIAGARRRCLVNLQLFGVNSLLPSLRTPVSCSVWNSPFILILSHSGSFPPLLVVIAIPVISPRSIFIYHNFLIFSVRIFVSWERYLIADLARKIGIDCQTSWENLTWLKVIMTYRPTIFEELYLLSNEDRCWTLLFCGSFYSHYNLIEIFIDIFARMNPNVSVSRLLRYLFDHAATSSDNLCHQITGYHYSQCMFREVLLLISVAIIEVAHKFFNSTHYSL